MGLKRNSATRLLFRCDTSGAARWQIRTVHPPTLPQPGSIVMEVKSAPCLLSVSPASLATQLDVLLWAMEGQGDLAWPQRRLRLQINILTIDDTTDGITTMIMIIIIIISKNIMWHISSIIKLICQKKSQFFLEYTNISNMTLAVNSQLRRQLRL